MFIARTGREGLGRETDSQASGVLVGMKIVEAHCQATGPYHGNMVRRGGTGSVHDESKRLVGGG